MRDGLSSSSRKRATLSARLVASSMTWDSVASIRTVTSYLGVIWRFTGYVTSAVTATMARIIQR